MTKEKEQPMFQTPTRHPQQWAIALTLITLIPSPTATAQTSSFACTSTRLYQDTIDLDHRGWGVDARGNWDGGTTLPDVLAGSIRAWDDVANPTGQTSASLYLNPLLGATQDCFLPHQTITGINVDRFGFSVAWVGDIDGDGREDFVVGAPRGGSGTERGRVYVFLSSDFAVGTLPATATGASLIIEGVVDGGRFGYSVANAGHFIIENPVSYGDIAIGAPGGNVGQPAQQGTIFVISGKDILRARFTQGMSALTFTSDAIWANTHSTSGSNLWDRYGHAVALAGDVNNDGSNDIIIGAPQYHENAGIQTTGRGYARVILGGPTHTQFTLRGEQTASRFGNGVGGEFDIDGGGHEVLVGAPFFDIPTNPNFTDIGKAYVWSHAQPVGYVRTHLGIAIEFLPGVWVGEQLGWGLAGIGDTNGDSLDEYAIGSYAFSETEQANACSSAPAPCAGISSTGGGDRSGRSVIHDGATGAALSQVIGEDRKDSCGAWASPIGDVNGDGKPDLVVSAFRWSPTPTNPNQREVGRLYLVLTP